MDSGFSLRPIMKTGILSFLIFLLFFFKNSFDSRTTLVFCDVGQGDGVYIRIDNQVDIVIDAGPEQKILDCLGKYMPFYDRTIELAFNTHPQKDHYGGFVPILERYKVLIFLMSPVDSSAKSFSRFKKLLVEKHVRVKPFYKDDTIRLKNARIRSVWPTNLYVHENANLDENDDGFYETRQDPNDFSQVVLLTVGATKILFTGDLSPSSEEIILKEPLSAVQILKVPHHGSKNGLIEPFLLAAKPKIAIISDGKNNKFGHPSPEIIKMLQKYKIPIRRTDQEGDIVFKF